MEKLTVNWRWFPLAPQSRRHGQPPHYPPRLLARRVRRTLLPARRARLSRASRARTRTVAGGRRSSGGGERIEGTIGRLD